MLKAAALLSCFTLLPCGQVLANTATLEANEP
jgi:hypothetical protein